jgi:methylated-DNA-protein-cysteine methyltransferase related protein
MAPRRIDLGTTAARRVLARARSIPPGRVSTYGELSPAAPRFAGAVLSSCDDPDVPWHRVVRADGSLAKGERQRGLLEAEGVAFRGRRVDLEEAWWEPQG